MYYYNSINKENYASIKIDEQLIKRTIVSCAVECKGSIEDIQAHLENVFNLHISEGSISNILNEAAERAKSFNNILEASSPPSSISGSCSMKRSC